MSVTVNDALLGAYYRRGENSVPNDANVKARGISFVGEGYRELLRQNTYWFTTKTYATQTVDGKDIYALNSDYREMIEVRYNGAKVYANSETTAANVYRFPPIYSPYPVGGVGNSWYYISGDDLILVPKSSETPTSYDITDITVSGTVATVTTSAAHGLGVDYWVEIDGCTQTELDGSKQVTTVPSTTTFTYTVASGTTSETPTATATRNNLEMKQYYQPTSSFTDLTDEITIPVRYKDVLSAYVFARLAQLEGERGDASDGFNEFNGIIKQMNQENLKDNL
ncbi:MAG: hypothetical protein K0U38_01530 [Epsilonproteobacteria bacterium]|nr:hypothetical protein [Campylobacterota bacterium]